MKNSIKKNYIRSNNNHFDFFNNILYVDKKIYI